jgi:RNA polymerase sigma-B factor
MTVNPRMAWTPRARSTTEQLAEARQLEATGRPRDARQAQAICWAVAVAHEDLARRWAMLWGNRGVPDEDRRQTARIGLYMAALKYDPARGVPFPGHARWWVRAQLTRTHPEHEVPHKQQERLRILGKLDRLELTEAETARRAGLTVEQVRMARSAAVHARPVSIDAPVSGGEGTPRTLMDVLPSEAADRYSEPGDVGRVLAAIDRLPVMQRAVLRLRYGVETGEPMTHGDVSVELRDLGLSASLLSREWVRRTEAEALAATQRILDRVENDPETAPDRLVAYVRAHPGCTLTAAAIAAGRDGRAREVREMCRRMGIEIRPRPAGRIPGYELYLTGAGAAGSSARG